MAEFGRLIEEMEVLEKKMIEKLKKAPQKKVKSGLKIKIPSLQGLRFSPSSIPKQTLKKLGFKPINMPKPTVSPYTAEEETEEAKTLKQFEEAIKDSPEATWLLIPVRFKFVLVLIQDMAYRENLTPELFLYKLMLEGLIKRYAKKRNFYYKHYPFIINAIERDLDCETRFFKEIKRILDLRDYDSSAIMSKTGREAYQRAIEEIEKLKKNIQILSYELYPLERTKGNIQDF
ncbi:MAG: hypothetical protein QW607_07605 [Desulfurococcaceae archaeon]